MKIKFALNYFAKPKEELKIILNNQIEPIVMQYQNNGLWIAELDFNYQQPLNYYYTIYSHGKQTRREYPFPQRIINFSTDTLVLSDSWRDIPPRSYLYTSAFKADLNNNMKLPLYNKTLIIKAFAPQAQNNLKISGAGEQLGQWDLNNALPLIQTGINEWSISLDAEKINCPLEFKFITQYNGQMLWQNGSNNILNLEIKDKETFIKSNFYPIFDIPQPRAAGIVLPVFSLKSDDSFGIGDFGDLKKTVDWALKAGQKIIQILPINDTTITSTWVDSYPYNSISIYAFHPMYMDLKALGPLKNKNKEYWFETEQQSLNDYNQVNYEEVNLLKNAYIKLAFEEQYKKVFDTKEYQEFFKNNEAWLRPYAAFRFLRDKYNMPDFSKWPGHQIYNEVEIKNLTKPGGKFFKEISFYYYLQYNLHLQLLDACNYARSKNIIIKGDIPIGISPNSVEAWTEPHYFNMDSQAGAPPDDFSVNGQNWGFPTYNWDAMSADGYSWWKRRFAKMAEYFDAYRIDHILGFFRIWQIPLDAVHGLLGQFAPSKAISALEMSKFGFNFKQQYLHPYISEDIINQTFGENAQKIKNIYLIPANNGFYTMQQDFETQSKIKAAFTGQNDKESLKCKEDLYALISNVLFVTDSKDSSLYHPRISALSSEPFKALDIDQQRAYTNLYNDYFYHRHNQFWKDHAMAKLPPLLQSTRMLACAEDLGMIPACVPDVMNALQILSLEIQRMPKNPLERFADTTKYPYLSVCTISTHDMSTLRGWWQEDYKQTQLFYNDYLGYTGPAPKEATPQICEEIIKKHLASPSILCILSFQDWLSIDGQLRAEDIEGERINIPANPQHYWRYRMHLNLEDLIENEELNAKIKNLTQQNGRV